MSWNYYEVENTPKTDTQWYILGHGHPIVIQHLARNPNLISEIQVYMAQNNDFNIKYYLVKNKNLVSGAQHILAHDEHPYIKSELLHNTNLVPELFSSLYLEFKHHVFDSGIKNMKYNNPKTQELLETALLLV